MAERHRLGDLQMREARHDAVGMFFGTCHQRRLECAQARIDFIGRIAYPKAEVGGDLVIARPRGVQACRRLPHQCTQPRFGDHMNIFKREVFGHAIGCIFGVNAIEPALDRGIV